MFGRPLGTVLVIVEAAQLLSTIVHSAVPNWGESFATLSNLGYVGCGIFFNYHLKPLTGTLGNPAFVMVFLGITSFSFHEEPVGHVQKHVLDITAGLLLVLHLACTATSAALTEMFSEISILRKHVDKIDTAFVLIFSSALLMLALLYSQIYANQLTFYLICAGSAALAAFFIRIRLSQCKRISIAITAFEFISVCSIAASAVMNQGELLGRTLRHATDPELYDVYHGFWHLHFSLVIALLNLRFGDILEQTTQPVENQRHIIDSYFFDAVGLLTFFAQSITMLLMKELEAPLTAVRVVLWLFAVLQTAHVAWFVYTRSWRWRGRARSVRTLSDTLPFLNM